MERDVRFRTSARDPVDDMSASQPDPAVTSMLLRLQCEAGNSAVTRMIQRRPDTDEVPHPENLERQSRHESDKDEGAPGNRPNLDVGDHGPGVSLLQRLLTNVFPRNPVPETDIFDGATLAAVKRFQAERVALRPATGGVGPGTWRMLDAWPNPLSAGQPNDVLLAKKSIIEAADLARQAGIPEDELVTCVAIAMAESGLRVWAYNDKNADGSVDRGLWQINSSNADGDEIFSEEINAFWMAKLSSRGRTWTPWVVFTQGHFRRHVPAVAAALGKPVPPAP